MDWIAMKTVASDTVGLSRDALHLLAGMGAQLFLVLVFRSWFGAIWPVAAVALAALGNEWLDLTSEIWPGEERRQQWWESGKDMVTTVLLPTVLLLVSRFAPGRFTRPPPSGPEPGTAASE